MEPSEAWPAVRYCRLYRRMRCPRVCGGSTGGKQYGRFTDSGNWYRIYWTGSMPEYALGRAAAQSIENALMACCRHCNHVDIEFESRVKN